MHFQNAKYYIKYVFKKFTKTCEKVQKLNLTNLVTKVKVENFHSQLKSHITKQLLTSISVDIRIFSILKSDIHRGLVASMNITFSGRWILMSTSFHQFIFISFEISTMLDIHMGLNSTKPVFRVSDKVSSNQYKSSYKSESRKFSFKACMPTKKRLLHEWSCFIEFIIYLPHWSQITVPVYYIQNENTWELP